MSGQEPKFGNEERNEVKRKIVYILGIRVRLACLSIYGGRESLNRKQCSQRSRGPTGPGGRTAKSPGPDGTAENMPSSSAKFKDGRL